MASNRDRLKAMSKKNSEAAKQLIDVPTLISDVAERPGEVSNDIQVSNLETDNNNTLMPQNPIQNSSDASENIQNELNEEKSDLEEKTESDTTEAIFLSPNQDNTIESNNNIQNEDVIVNSSNCNVFISDVENNSDDISASIPDNINLADKYQGQEVIISLLLQPESNNYLTYKAMDLRTSSKQLLKDLLIKELKQGYKEDDLCPLYRRTQHQTVKRSIVIDKQLKADIQETAIKYRMRYTAFISYVIYKAYINDSEYKELM